MTGLQRAILAVVSRMMDYPSHQFHDERSTIVEYLKDYISTASVRETILKRISPLYEMDLVELQQLYVESFDYKEKTGLYLTAHELGDSRKRGTALITLQKLISECGYDFKTSELADYIPMLLELLAVVPEDENSVKLCQRLALAVHRILDNLPTSNPYHGVIHLLIMFVLKVPAAEEIAMLENEREEADLDELPYPVMYR